MTPADPVVALVVASAVVLAAVRVPRSAARISPGRRAHAAGAGRSTGPRSCVWLRESRSRPSSAPALRSWPPAAS